MLDDGHQHSDPFPFFTAQDALGDEVLRPIEALFDGAAWQDHDQPFYRARLADVTDHVEVPAGLPDRMEALTGLPLTDRVRVTIQQMQPGQFVDVHTDRPLLGYAAARLVVQLNRGWTEADGGVLQIHPDADGIEVSATFEPRFDTAFGFAMRPSAHHSVSPVHSLRRTVVFDFWHVANTADTARIVHEMFEGLDIAALPDHPHIREAEATLPEDVTFDAACGAWLLLQRGYPNVIAAYRELLGTPTTPEVADAAYVVGLRNHDFDVDRWQLIKRSIKFET